MNFYALGKLICMVRPHRWSKAKEGVVNPDFPEIGISPLHAYAKRCIRCGLVRPVKRRKVQP